MNTNENIDLLGGLSAADFMLKYWQKKPYLVRSSVPALSSLVQRAELFSLAQNEDVESRLILRSGQGTGQNWTVRHGPIPRKSIPSLKTPCWTLLVQGVDLHHDAAYQ